MWAVQKSVSEEYVAWKNWSAEDFGKFERSDAVYFAAETGIRGGEGARILELGFGNGAFLCWAKSLGAEVWGVETNPVLLESAAKLLGVDRVFKDLSDSGLNALSGSLTLIVAFDVIEHVAQDQLPRMLAQMGRLLSREGRIILRFPNGDSPFGRINQHGDPTHVTTLGRGKIEYFATASGLSAKEIRAPALPLFGLGALRMVRRAALLVGRRALEALVAFLYFNGRTVPMDPNYIAVLVPGTAVPQLPR